MEKVEDKCCGSCAFWRPLSDYEGVCVSTSGLSANIDVTEIRYVCPAYINTLKIEEGADLLDD